MKVYFNKNLVIQLTFYVARIAPAGKMSCEDLQLEDIVLLQLFKDQIMTAGLDQGRGEEYGYRVLFNNLYSW